jgi:hypothetical protein
MDQLIAMSDDDITSAYYSYVPSSRDEHLNIYLRSDLKDLKKLPSRPFIILYETTPSNGHWVLVHDTIDGKDKPCIEFFDSYGSAPDTQQKFISRQFADLKDPTVNLLRLLWNDTGGRVIFNDHRLQGPSTYTCGRHCMARLIGGKMDIDAYVARVRKIGTAMRMTPDELVAFAIPPSMDRKEQFDETKTEEQFDGGCLACQVIF